MRRTTRTVLAVTVAASAATGGALALSSGGAAAAAFTGGNVVVYRVGSGAALSNAAAPVFLDEYGPSGGAALHSTALPTSDGSGRHALTAAGQSTSEGELSRSADGHEVVLTGYDAAPGATGPGGESLTATSPSTVGRTVAVVANNGVDTSTVLTGGNVPFIVRSAATAHGSSLAVAGGNGGLLTAIPGAGSASTAAGSTDSNLNGVSIQGGKLFVSGSFGNRLSVLDGSTLTPLPGIPATLLAYGYTLLDTRAGVGYDGTSLDTLYVADAADRGGSIEKYTYTGSTWHLAGSVELDGVLGLVGDFSNGQVSLAATTAKGLYTLSDSAPQSSGFSATPAQIASAPAKTEFRGVALAPTGSGTVTKIPKGDVAPGKSSLLTSKVKHSGFTKTRVHGAPRGKGLTTAKRGKVRFTYYGSALTLHLVGGKGSGEITVTIAGKKHTVSLYRAKPGGFTARFHTAGHQARKVVITASHKKRHASKGYRVTLGWLVVTA